MEYAQTMCCGVAQAEGLNNDGNPREAMLHYVLEYVCGDDAKGAHIVFTEAHKTHHSTGRLNCRSWWPKLAAYIKKRGLGSVVSSPWKVNPNTKNFVRVHVVTPNISALKKLFAKEIAKEQRERREYNDYWCF